MIKSINNNFGVSKKLDLDKFEERLMEQLESRDEFVCYGEYCSKDFSN